ncbi:MAG TPA: hypothetical protein VMV46_13830 [Thermoanaerobaculia bacterium]|nr:hypothetical protein [Thermoanaerobaculia bacterium]
MTGSLRAGLDVLAAALTVLAVWAAGSVALRPLRARIARYDAGAPEPAPELSHTELSHTEALVAGLLLLHLLLQGLDLVGVPWHPYLLGGCGLAATAAWTWARRGSTRDQPTKRAASQTATAAVGIGDALAAIAVAAFGLACWFLRSPFSDFVYHWGLKAKRFFLHRGTDFEFLARDANGYLHPDYPNLWPELFAVPAILSGRFFEPALLPLTAVFLAFLALVLRAELRRVMEPSATRQLALPALVLGVTAFCIGYYQAGSADLPFALALLLGASALSEPRAGPATLRAGLAAAFAAALKIEGPPFAAILLALVALRHGRELWRRPKLVALAGVPAALVIAPWAYLLARHDLYQPTNSAGLAALDPARLVPIAEHAWRVLLQPQWHGLPLLLLALPLLLLARSCRWIAYLCGLQLAFYLYVYASAPLEPGFFVLSSFPRLLLHVLPAVGLAAFAALAALGEKRPPRGGLSGPG